MWWCRSMRGGMVLSAGLVVPASVSAMTVTLRIARPRVHHANIRLNAEHS
jgi:hypothetical protein